MPILRMTGDLLADDADALVNAVNTRGVMGRGLALQFKRGWPSMFEDYAAACRRGEVALGRMHVWETGAATGPRFVVNFPTKGHWRARSHLADIEAGLLDLVRVVREREIGSVAVPPLGCGLGGLEWQDVEPLVVRAFEPRIEDVQVHLFVPDDGV